jgi:hypothetical protein
MSMIRHLSKSRREFVSYRTAIVFAATLGLLLARCVPPSHQELTSAVVASSIAAQNHNQCFDHDDFQWLTPPAATLTAPVTVASSHAVIANGPRVDVVADGWHYNRPPPVG